MRSGDTQRYRAVGCLEYPISLLRQNLARQTSDRGLVLDQQNRAGQGRTLVGYWRCFVGGALAERSVDERGVEGFESGRREQLPGQDRGTFGRALDLIELLGVFRVFAN